MKREEIEKAAKKEAEELACLVYYGGSAISQEDVENACVKIAEWRINSVWHDANETPISGKEALVKYITGDLKIKYRVDVFAVMNGKKCATMTNSYNLHTLRT